ncbi:MAG: phosphoenolpyruvate carboxylase, partial [Pseudomonadota bacterium]|nr:phosphoenolpyruvate carboxylase [Pseudomonadota bacterium]
MLETISNNVRALGEVLGQTIAEDKGDGWVDKIEEVRLLGKRIVAGENHAVEDLQTIFANSSEQDLLIHARAFSQFLNLANVAEQQHTTSEQGLAELDLPHPLDSLSEKLTGIDANAFKQALKKLH